MGGWGGFSVCFTSCKSLFNINKMIENIKFNFKEHCKPNLLCNSCNLYECDQKYLIDYSKLIGSNEFIAYIPDYMDIFNNQNIQEQMYI